MEGRGEGLGELVFTAARPAFRQVFGREGWRGVHVA
jgi:hypothetical protein